MDTKPLEKFAQSARRQLHEQVAARLERVLHTDSAELRGQAAAIADLKKQIAASSRQAVIERVAYTWFNRFCALRFMDVHGYTGMGVVSPAAGHTQPEILLEAKQGHIDEELGPSARRRAILDLLAGRAPSRDPQGEAYRLLLVAVCNAWHDAMPFLFERIDDYSELLMPDDLLSADSILHGVRQAMTPERCQDVEIIGWLYQFYISEKKDQVIGAKQKIEAGDIPAATQLFTPHWIVRFLVENSLGRLWLLNHPESRLAERMEYYISEQLTVNSEQSGTDHRSPNLGTGEPGSPFTDHLPLSSPEELRVGDPAVGSGHMLTYAFDLLYAIYEEQGYSPREIPRLILEYNLYGMEIDERAGALAAFALTMKARARDSRFFRRGVRPHIVILRPIQFGAGELRPLLDGMVDALIRQAAASQTARPSMREALLHDLHLWAEADNFGALLRPQLSREQIAAVQAQVAALAAGRQRDLLVEELRGRLLQALAQAEALARPYHVVVANPPYMGSSTMNAGLARFAQAHYPESKADLFAMFMERNLDLVAPCGLVAMITMQSWMFLSSFEKLRARLLDQDTILAMAHLGPRAFDTISGEVVSTTAFVVERAQRLAHRGSFLRLVTGNNEAGKESAMRASLPAPENPLPANYYLASAADFKKIPGSPIAYWVSNAIRRSFETYPSLSLNFFSDGLTKTGDNDKFLRFHWEVARNDGENQNRYRICVKGGEARSFFGNTDVLVKWTPEVRDHYRSDSVARITPEYLWERSGISWTKISSRGPTFRWFGNGMIAETGGPAVFAKEQVEEQVFWQGLGFLTSKVSWSMLLSLNPTVNFQTNDVLLLPFRFDTTKQSDAITRSATHLSALDWDNYETAWSFADLPLLRSQFHHSSLTATFATLRAHWKDTTVEMQRLQEENNRIFIDAYGLQDELTPDVPLSEITLTCNPWYRYGGQAAVNGEQWTTISERWPEVAEQLARIAREMAPDEPEARRLGLEQRLLADTMRELVSYAVGCMFGRDSLDKPGLILANQGETVADYVRKVRGSEVGGSEGQKITFMPDRDNAIPILDGDWFDDDIVGRFRQFLRVAFGEEHFADNLAFVEAALGRDLRSFFLREFYDDHLKRYKKRPIYWLFSSAKGSFNVLISMHRYRPDTVSVVLNGYLREFQSKLRARRGHLERLSVSLAAAPRDKTSALKEIERLDKTLAELAQYEDEVLYPLAARRLEIDLDDGVKVNYARFGAALKRVAGLND